MDRGTDVFGALAWGLRRYAWLVVLAVLAVGALVPFVQSRAPDVYEAEATITVQTFGDVPNSDVLPKYGEQSFSNGAVAAAVRDLLNVPDSTAVIPERVELVAEQDGLAYSVIGRADNADDAATLANSAASTFLLELNASDPQRGIGVFALQQQAAPPGTPEPKFAGGPLALVLGVVAGLVLGVALVALLVLIRRPVLDAETAQDATGAPVLGRVTLPRGHGDVKERDAYGLGPLCRRLLAGSAPVILMVSPGKAAELRHRLTSAMASLLGRNRSVMLSKGGEQADLPSQWGLVGRRSGRMTRTPGTERGELVLVDGPTVDERTNRPDSALTVLVAPEGIGFNALRQAADEYLDGEHGGVVLVRTHGRGGLRREPPAPVGASRSADESDEESPDIFDDHDPDERAS